MVIYIGVVQLPEASLHRSKKQLYCGTIIPNTMDRDRFQILMQMLHFADNSSPSTSLAKIDSLMDKLIHNFQTVNTLVADETMVPFHGRVKFCQYIPGKNHRYQFKIFKLCTVTVDGYT